VYLNIDTDGEMMGCGNLRSVIGSVRFNGDLHATHNDECTI
jgi:hypothetical protein